MRSGGALTLFATPLRKNPVYPAAAKERAISGTVEVRFRINPEGKVYDVRPVNGSADLWRKRPWKRSGAGATSQRG